MSPIGRLNKDCNHCESCRYCELIKVWKDLDNTVSKFIHIHNTTSDVVMSNQLMYQAAIESKGMLLSFQRQLKQLGIDF